MEPPIEPTRNLTAADLRSPRPRRKKLPLILFLATCFSTFWAGANHWSIITPAVLDLDQTLTWRWLIVAHGSTGLYYMSAVVGILLAHEMGHFVAALRCHIPASLPYFIPVPFSPIGTMGAVIGLAGHRANRRQIFDIGIAGPLAGLVCLIPILYLGIQQLDLSTPRAGGLSFDCPWLVRMVFSWMRPHEPPLTEVWVSQLNPMFMAAWVGLLVTGLNMIPVSQLDGGHILYALLLQRAHFVARGLMIAAAFWIAWSRATSWLLMLVLVILLGVDHPPTADDTVPLGWQRTMLGWLSLVIPFLCFPPRGILVHL